jgi:hypothetical protein
MEDRHSSTAWDSQGHAATAFDEGFRSRIEQTNRARTRGAGSIPCLQGILQGSFCGRGSTALRQALFLAL